MQTDEASAKANQQLDLSEQITITGQKIFKAPESLSDVIVTGSAVIALAIGITLVFRAIERLFLSKGNTKD